VASRRNSSFKIGITGNICTGKSLVLATLQRQGFSTFNPEQAIIQNLITTPQDLYRQFDHDLPDEWRHLSRKKLMNILYHNPAQKSLFEETLNPLIREEIKRFLFSPVGTLIRAVEAPALLENDTSHLYDEVWMIVADPEQQIERLMEREQLTRAQARYHVDAQWDQQKKAQLSNRVIDNSSSIQQTESQVRKILDELNLQLLKIGL
jgi:dephospho-CoA kinase